MADYDGTGLIPAHAYSLIQVKEINTRDGKNIKLLNIRNPWGNFEWNGDWSDMSPLWTEEMKHKIQPSFDEDDGSFWMSYDDF